MSSIWKECTFSWIDNLVKRETEIVDKRRFTSPQHYFIELARKENKYITQTDFSLALQGIFPDDLLVFDAKQKETLDRIANFIETPEEFAVHMQLLAKVLSDFEKNDSLGDPIAQVTLKNYDYLKLKIKHKFPVMYASFQRQISKSKAKVEEKESRPKHCGKPMMSSGANWRCGICGKYQVKNPRRKQK